MFFPLFWPTWCSHAWLHWEEGGTRVVSRPLSLGWILPILSKKEIKIKINVSVWHFLLSCAQNAFSTEAKPCLLCSYRVPGHPCTGSGRTCTEQLIILQPSRRQRGEKDLALGPCREPKMMPTPTVAAGTFLMWQQISACWEKMDFFLG